MELTEAIRERRSVRRFTSIPVEWAKISDIVDAGRHAPSAGNVQDWRFVVIEDPDKITKIAGECLDQRFIEQAPVVIVVCSDTELMRRTYGDRGEDLYAIQNCAAATQNMLLKAHELGLGSCWVGAFDENAIRRIVKIPGSARPLAILPLGYPDEEPRKPRKNPATFVVFFEKYGNKIKDMEMVLGVYSKAAEKHAKKLGRLAKNAAKRVVSKVKKKLKK